MKEFVYYPVIQRSPEWFELRRGKVTSSRLEDWMSTSKAKATLGQPLKARLDYEKELMFERQFGVNYNNYFSDAMQDGVDFESFGAQQYELLTGNVVEVCGCWVNDVFCASPDRVVFPKGSDTTDIDNAIGLVEIKIVRDNTFTEILMADPKTSHAIQIGEDEKGKPVMVGTGIPEKHWKQVQGQLRASGLPWCDYVVVNLNTKKVVIIRIDPDSEFHEYLELSLHEKLVMKEFALTNVHDIVGELPQGIDSLGIAPGEGTDNNSGAKGDWDK